MKGTEHMNGEIEKQTGNQIPCHIVILEIVKIMRNCKTQGFQ